MFVYRSKSCAFGTRKAFLMTATAIASLIAGSAAYSADVTIASGSTVGQQSVNDGDTLIIENGATVNSATPGVVDAVDGATITVQNDGTITSTADSAIDNSGSTLNLTNNGSISGATNGILSQDVGVLVNNADIVGSSGYGVYFTGDTALFTNSGSITGLGIAGIRGDGMLTSLTNTGLITGSPIGLFYFSIGSVANSGTISGATDGIIAGTFTSLTNTGLITGSTDAGIRVLGDLGTVNNTGTISGGSDGIITSGKLDSLTNTGLITGIDESGIDTGGLFGFLNNMGTISGDEAGIDAADLGTVVNSGLITGADGIFSNDNLLSLTNTGTISGVGGACFCSPGAGVYVVNTAESIINHGAITGEGSGIDVLDLNNLINTGTITGENTDGVYVDGGTIGNLFNTGSITGAIHAVDARYITMLTNTGSLTGGDDGILAQTITTLTNTGSITGTSDDGILAESLVNLINDGTIAGGDDGIDVLYITNLTNNGSISGQDEGVKSREITLLTNNGTITGGGASDESGIDTDFGTIVNNGLIQGGIGIEFDRNNSIGTNPGNAKVTNYGTIKSFSGTSGVAIDFQGTGADTLTLTRNSVLVGMVNWDGVDDTLNLDPNMSTVIKFSNLPETTNTSSNFVIFDGTTLIQIDTSFLASLDNVVLGTSDTINNSVFNQLNDAIFGRSNISPQAYNPAEAEGVTKVWNSNWFSYNELQTTNTITTDYTRSLGSVFGVEKTLQSGTSFGAYAGLGLSHTKMGSTVHHLIDADTYVAGVYSKFSRDHANIDVNFQLGQLKFDSRRQQTNNSVSSGFETASANYDSFYVAPNVRFSREISTENGINFIPSLALGYTGIYVEDYSETGSSANATIASRTIHQFQARAELGLRYDWVSDNDVEYTFNPYAGLEGRMGSGDIDQVTGTIGSASTTFNPGGDKNVGAIFAGMNVNAKLSESSRFEGAAEAKVDSESQFAFTTSWGVKLKF